MIPLLNTLINLTVFTYLLIATYTDIKTRLISFKLSIMVIFICLVINIILLNFDIKSILLWILYSCIVGLSLIILAFISKENIGYGDGIAVLVIGMGNGIKCSFLSCGFAFILAAIFASLLLIKKRNTKTTIPFLPFLSTGYTLQYFIL